MEEFSVLAERFTTLNVRFEDFESTHKANLPKSRKQYEERLKVFATHLSSFADLQFAIIKHAVVQDEHQRKAQHIDVINIVINKIQYLYMGPLSLELSRRYNLFNTRLAVFSIIFGALLGMSQPYISPWLEKFYHEVCDRPLPPQKKPPHPPAKRADRDLLYRDQSL